MLTAQEDGDDAEITRDVVRSVVDESDRADASTDSGDEMEREIEEALQDDAGGPSSSGEQREGPGEEESGSIPMDRLVEMLRSG